VLGRRNEEGLRAITRILRLGPPGPRTPQGERGSLPRLTDRQKRDEGATPTSQEGGHRGKRGGCSAKAETARTGEDLRLAWVRPRVVFVAGVGRRHRFEEASLGNLSNTGGPGGVAADLARAGRAP